MGRKTLPNELTQYHQQRQHHHGTNAHWRNIPAQITVRAQHQAFACKAGKDRRNVHQRVERVALQQPGDAQEWLNEHFVVQPVKAPGVVPPGTQQTARRAVGDRGHQRTLTQPQPCGNQDTGNCHDAWGDFQRQHAAMFQLGRCRQYAVQRRHNQRPHEGRQHHQHNQRQVMGNPLPGVRMNLLFTVEDDEDHTEGVQRGHERADQTRHHQIDMAVSHRPGKDFVFTEEARGNQRQRGERGATDQEAGIHQRNRLTQATHLEDVLFVMTGQNHRAGRQEQQRFEERMGHQMENRRVPRLYAQRQEHVANLAHGRVREYTFDVGLHQRGKACQHQRNRPNDTHQMQHFRRHQEQAVSTGNQVDTGGYHGGSVDQRGDRRWASHRVRKPGLQRQLRGFTHGTAQQHQRCPHQHVIACGKVRRRQFHHFAEVQRAQLVVENEQREREEHVTHAGYHEGFHRRRAVLRIGVVETDQQIGAQAHAFPAQIHQQQVIGQYQNHHAGDKQVGVGEEAGVALFTAHVPGGEHVDQETDPGHHREHGQRQAVQHQVETDIEITDGHPRPQRLAERLLTVSEEVDACVRRHQRGQTNRANPHGGGEVFRPAPAREGQQDKAN